MLRTMLILSLLFFLVASGVLAQNDPLPIPVIIDTDFAADDWLATLYLLNYPGVEVRALSLTGVGESHCNPGIQNALNLLELAGQPDIPVACGRETPLEGTREFPADWRTSMDAMMWIPLPANDALPYSGTSVQLLRDTILASEQPPVLVTLGPLTNIAELFAADPSLADRIARIVIMGGAVHVPGNIDTDPASPAEWNIYVDPTAANQVFQSGAQITLVPLDATNQAPLGMDFLQTLGSDLTTPAAEFAFNVLNSLSGSISAGTFYFWDPLTAGIAADPTLATTQGRPIHVVTDQSADSGRTVPGGPSDPVQVVMTVESERFRQAFLDVFNGRPVDTALSETAPAVGETVRQPVIIDTDFAADDWLAILYLLNHPGVDVRAVVLEGTGETHCNPGVQNALNLLELAGRPDIPVACGRETPLEGRREFPADWRTSVDAMMWLSLPMSATPPYAADALALLREAIHNSPQPPVLLTLGPLTNIAELFRSDPSLAGQIGRVVIMGGAVSAQGDIEVDVSSPAEWNIYIDPLAADVVFRSGAPITLVPLDATNQAPLTMTTIEIMGTDLLTPSARFAHQALAAVSGSISAGGYTFRDPLAAGIAADPSLATLQNWPMSVVTGMGLEGGRTYPDANGSPMDMVTGVDSARFEQAFRNVLNGRAMDAPLPETVVNTPSEPLSFVLVRRYFEEGWGDANSELLRALTAPGYTLTGNDPVQVEGVEALVNRVTLLHTLLPDLTVEVESLYEADDTVFARVILRGMPASASAPVVIALHSTLRIERGRIAEEWQALDFSPLLGQLP